MSSANRENPEPEPGGNGVTAAHVCDICGVNQSSRGKVFTNHAEVWQHKRKRHPEACGERPHNGASVATVTARPARKKAVMPAPMARRSVQVQFCPNCGCNLQAVHAAMEFVNEAANI